VYLPGFPIKNFQLSRYGKISFINMKYDDQGVVVQECDATDA